MARPQRLSVLSRDHVEVARLAGVDVQIRPLANLACSDQHSVYGIIGEATHRELDRLYAHAREVLGGVYLPHPVVVETLDGDVAPALCYIAPTRESPAASTKYLDRIVTSMRGSAIRTVGLE